MLQETADLPAWRSADNFPDATSPIIPSLIPWTRAEVGSVDPPILPARGVVPGPKVRRSITTSTEAGHYTLDSTSDAAAVRKTLGLGGAAREKPKVRFRSDWIVSF